MPEKHGDKPRKMMVIEEVEKSTPIDKEPEVVDETEKVSSQELISKDNVQIADTGIATSAPLTSSRKLISPFFWIIIPGIFILGMILGGIVFYQKGVNKGETISDTPTPTPQTSASPSTTTVVDLTKYTIVVLNGSGIAGEAGKVKTLLTDAGFDVGSTGNAATYDYTKTIIKSQKIVDAAFISELSTALGKSYVVESSQSLATSSADKIQVVIGTSKP